MEHDLYCKEDDVHLSVAGNRCFAEQIRTTIVGLEKVKYLPSTVPEAAQYLVFAARAYATIDFRGHHLHFFDGAAKQLIEESSALFRAAAELPEDGHPATYGVKVTKSWVWVE